MDGGDERRLVNPKDQTFAQGTGEIPRVNTGVMRDEDVASLAHDLRTPLGVISLEIATLEEKCPGLRHEARDALARIDRNLKYLDNLLQDLLDLAAIDAARLEVHREPTELCGLVAEVVDRMVPSRDRGRVHVAFSGPIDVCADASRIERVVANLLQNALKYAGRSTEIKVVVEEHDHRACVSVIDEGIGLPPDEASHVFEKFRRMPSAKRHDGVGLGLYVSRRIVEAHAGKIGVESKFGSGSRFYFELPIEDARTA